jgi:hypothetical protein
MSAAPQTWFAWGSEGTTRLRCAVCQTNIDLESAPADHHPRVCPACGVGCLFIDWRGRPLQLVTDRAPQPVADAARWAQKQFDELEFVEFLCGLEQIAGALNADPAKGENHPLQPTGPAQRRSEP